MIIKEEYHKKNLSFLKIMNQKVIVKKTTTMLRDSLVKIKLAKSVKSITQMR